MKPNAAYIHSPYRFFWSFILLLMLFSCNGGGDSVNTTANFSLDQGSLNVVVSGLPANQSPSIVVSGPNQYSQALKATATLSGLSTGIYTIAASKVFNGTVAYGPQPASQTIAITAAATATANITYAQQETVALALQPVATGLALPVYLTAPAGDTRLFIVERAGPIRIVQNGTVLPTAFLDIHDRTTNEGERGLLSMAFDPKFSANGFFYVYFTALNGAITIERYTVSSSDANVADVTSRFPILSIPHATYNNHNGGLLSFGPDNFLYMGTGDGGGAGDPLMNAQNTNSLLGKLLRIDVSASTTAQPYAIPPTNPFVNQSNKRGEIWAYGLRNPWRFAFDTLTNLLYIADVGQDRREEVNVARLDQPGLNYGWNIMEGTLCYPSGDSCNKQDLTLPIIDIDHSNNSCAIVGGYVYRGSALPELQSDYFYSDLCVGKLNSFVYFDGMASEQFVRDIPNVDTVYSFGEDSQKELYVLSGSGTVYRITRK